MDPVFARVPSPGPALFEDGFGQRRLVLGTSGEQFEALTLRDELIAIRDFARKRGIAVISDEVYGTLVYDDSKHAPSFLEICDADDNLFVVNSFSKPWAMTGWRIGWIAASPALGQVIENLVQYSTSGVAQFMQRAAVAALERGESFVTHQIARARQSRDIICDALTRTGRCRRW